MSASKNSVRLFLLCVALVAALFSFVSSVSADDVPVNGHFDSNVDGWSMSGGSCNWSSGEGHTAVGSLHLHNSCNAGNTNAFSFSGSGSLSFWYKNDCDINCTEARTVTFEIDCDGGFYTDVASESPDTDWTEFSFSVGESGIENCFISFFPYGGWTEFYIDDVTISGALNGSELPTSTPAPTNTPVPTNTPAPTSTSIPTNTPIGGVVGGGGAGLCPSTDPCYVIVQNTPLPVDLVGVGGTPVSGGGAIPVTFATRQVTAVSAASSGVTVGGSSAVFRSSGVSGVMPVGGSGGHSVGDIVGVDIDKNDVGGCLPGDVAQVIDTDGNDCVTVPIYTVNSYKMLGVDLLAGFAVVAGVLFVVFIVRQLQEK